MDISPQRLSIMRTAIELGVDETDFAFRSFDERVAWRELADEHQGFCERGDLVWIAA